MRAPCSAEIAVPVEILPAVVKVTRKKDTGGKRSVGVKRVYRFEEEEERVIKEGEREESAGPGARKPETEPASQTSQPDQPAKPEKGERTTPMMNHPPGVSRSEGGRKREGEESNKRALRKKGIALERARASR
ncbi:hypothetical protein KM043_009599 [Ampulex compressa]|nr:hypothetical protein KM043_009599 [Ampulex compressa]